MNKGNVALAFPSVGPDVQYLGMTLRDYFAAAALCTGETVWEGKGSDQFGEMAKTCYRIADAMLAERAK
jgi:hypothetical protein